MESLGPLSVESVDENAVEDLVMALRDQRLAIEHARELGTPLMESYVDSRTDKTLQRRARGLGNGTINLAINAIQAVLKAAHKRHVIARLPDLSDEKLKGSRPRRSYLQIVEIAASSPPPMPSRPRPVGWIGRRSATYAPRPPQPWPSRGSCTFPTR
jgi:hypothetical protein